MIGRQLYLRCLCFNHLITGCAVVTILSVVVGCASDDLRYQTLGANSRSYTVKRGDTLYGIGKRTHLDYRRLAEWNKIRYPYTIKPGQIIRLDGAEKSKSISAGSSRKYYKSSPQTVEIKKNQKKLKKKLKLYWQWPIRGVIAKNFSQTGRKGLDIVGKYGEPVRAAARGKIVYSGQGLIGYGNLVIVKHSGHYLSAYGNNKRLLVREGDTVRLGQKIAEVGRSAAKRASLHFEIRKDGKPVNPILYLPKP